MPCVHNHNETERREAAKEFANVFARAYLESSDEVRKVIDVMARICSDESVDPDTKDSALDTLTEALFPQMQDEGMGVDLDAVKTLPMDGPDPNRVEEEMIRQEATFAMRLADVMQKKEINQVQLAEAVGVGQPAIANMLARQCRPQRRTIEKLAKALGITPAELWPA